MTFRENEQGEVYKGISKWEALQIIRNGFRNAFLTTDVKDKLIKIVDYKIFEILSKECTSN